MNLKRMQGHLAEQMVDSLVPQSNEEIVEGAACGFAGVSGPQIQEHDVDVIKSIPQVRVSARVVEQIADVTVPSDMKEIAEVAKFHRDEHVKVNLAGDGNIHYGPLWSAWPRYLLC